VLDLLSSAYLWIKAAHIVSVMSWMAGLFYLPRLMVYHAEKVSVSVPQAEDLFRMMEYKLLRFIMNPAMIATWVFGLVLVTIPGIVDWSAPWVWIKALSVVAMSWFHIWLAGRRREFAEGRNTRSGRTYRLMNEVPTILMLLIVFSVVLKF
jgi:protoporphyrinogen IX oxidase